MWFIPLQVGIPIWPPTYMWVGDTRPSVYPSSLRTHTYSAISTEESYCPSSLVSVERPLLRDRSTIRPLGFAERILRDISILFLSSAIRSSLNKGLHSNGTLAQNILILVPNQPNNPTSPIKPSQQTKQALAVNSRMICSIGFISCLPSSCSKVRIYIEPENDLSNHPIKEEFHYLLCQRPRMFHLLPHIFIC